MSDLGGRLLAFVPTRRAAIVLFVVALAVYWLQALGWPMAKGRDTWDYLVYYLQFLDGDPPLSQVQLFRTPLTPLVVGLPMAIGGSALLEIVFGVLFAVGVVAWSATALVFGRVPALASAVLLLVYPAWATLYHQASSDAVFATGLALWALVLARTLRWPSTWGFVALGLGIAILVLIRPANQVLLPAVLVPLLAAAPWRRRLTWVAACLAAAVLPLAGWAVHNGIRYDDATVARGGRAWVPFLKVWLDDRTVAPENGAQSRRLADLIERHVLTEEPFASLHVPLDAYLANGSNYETVRLIALSDRYLGRDDDYEAIFGSAIEAIRAHPRTYFRGVADVFWQFLMQAPIREGIAPRAQTEPAPPPATYTRDGVVLPNPAATVLVPAVPYGFVWCASDYIDSCTLDDPSVVWKDAKTQRRYREVVSQVRAWDAELPSRSGQQWVTEILDRITPRFPRPPLWIAVGVVALLWRRPRGWQTILVLWGAAAAVLGIHAASQGVAPEFALPLYPLFIVTALAALAGDRGPARRSRPPDACRRGEVRAGPRAHAARRRASLPDARPAELLARRARHRVAARSQARRRPRRDPADRGDAVPLLRRRLGLELGLRARRGRPAVALRARGDRDDPGRVRSRGRSRVPARGHRRRRARRDEPVPRLVLAGGAVVRAVRAARSDVGAHVRARAPRRPPLAGGVGVTCALTLATHYFGVFLVGAEAVWLLVRLRPRLPVVLASLVPGRDPPRPPARAPRPAWQRRSGRGLVARGPGRRHPEEPRRRLQLSARGRGQRPRCLPRARRSRARSCG